MTSPTSKLGGIEAYIEQVSMLEEQLLNRKKQLHLLQDLRSRPEITQTDDPSIIIKELEQIDLQLKTLREKKIKFQRRLAGNYGPEDQNYYGVTLESSKKTNSAAPVCPDPKNIVALEDIVNLEDLPAQPFRIKCPECRQYIMTETVFSTSSATWIACCSFALIGCVAGCCLLPFCLDRYKTITHRCPLCRTCIRTMKKL